MTHHIPGRSGGSGSLAKNALLLVLAFIVAVLLWNVIGFLAGVVIFALVVYVVYLVLRRHI
jgi:Flp pilus assembly protein TadB